MSHCNLLKKIEMNRTNTKAYIKYIHTTDPIRGFTKGAGWSPGIHGTPLPIQFQIEAGSAKA